MRYFRVHPALKRLFFMVNLCVFSYRYLPIFTYLCTHSDITCDTTFDIFLVIPKFKMTILSYPTSRFVFDRKNRSSDKRKGLVQLEIKHDRKRKWISTGVKLYKDQWNEKTYVVNFHGKTLIYS